MTLEERIKAARTMAELRSIREEIRGMIDQEGADLEALNEAVDLLDQRAAEMQQAAETRSALMARVAGGEGTQVRGFDGEGRQRASVPGADSPEYRRAFLLNLMGRGEEMTAEERAAYTHTTTNTSAVLPTTMIQGIWDLVSQEHCIMEDITIYRTGTIIEVVKHTAIVKGGADTVNEAAARADDEQNTFVKVTLSGKDFSKHVNISYALATMSVDGFEAYLTGEIGRELGRVLAEDVVSTVKTGANAANKIETKTKDVLTFPDTVGALALLEHVGSNIKLYMNRKTFYTRYVSLVDSTGQPIFQPSVREGEAGTLLGNPIRLEAACADDEVLILDPSCVVYNMVQDIMIESDRDIKSHVITYAGYCRGEGALINDKGAAVLTVKTA